MHRDIKPSNLILGEDEQIYLVDFGAVQDTAAKEGGTFTVVGTYGYTPIEQFGGRAVPASDLYALGATLIHLLTGIAPADLPQKDFRIHFSDKVGIRAGLVRWIEKLVEPSLEKRFSTVGQSLAALKASTLYVKSSRLSALDLHNHKIQIPSNKRIGLSKSTDKFKIKVKSTIQIKRFSNIEKFIKLYLKVGFINKPILGFSLIIGLPLFGIFVLILEFLD